MGEKRLGGLLEGLAAICSAPGTWAVCCPAGMWHLNVRPQQEWTVPQMLSIQLTRLAWPRRKQQLCPTATFASLSRSQEEG